MNFSPALLIGGIILHCIRKRSQNANASVPVLPAIRKIEPIAKKSGKVLLTGGAGYIGSHILVELLHSGYDVVVVDNLSNSNYESIRRVGIITARAKAITFCKVDLRNRLELYQVFHDHGPINVVIHCAGLKAVGESTKKPLEYYENNVKGTINLLHVMKQMECGNLVFSSSATVYGSAKPPYSEQSQTGVGITNPYGQTKHIVESMLEDLVKSNNLVDKPEAMQWNIVSLRYFNPIGAHPSGAIGEDPMGIPNNLMPYIAQVCVGKRPYLIVHGDDYDTIDGTGVRDYIHVCDLAEGHVAALEQLKQSPVYRIYNLGTGKGVSVLQLVKAMQKTIGSPITYKIGPRRPGDLAEFFAIPKLAKKELNWKTHKSIKDMCEDTWRWQKANPFGYNRPKLV